ncbi:DUF6221 family protein [Nocardiopsis algeriensis]|uniref:DUF6221 family protein n=1 Tax=Nocardiopsis algeriensis TaxID=1478215 RepID=UPI003B431C8F
MTLIEFLNARLNEDEAAARKALPGPWHVVDGDTDRAQVRDSSGGYVAATGSAEASEESLPVPGTAAHIARHHPERVLREVAAKRAAITEIQQHSDFFGRKRKPVEEGLTGYTLRVAAAAYSDHPDFDREWAL